MNKRQLKAEIARLDARLNRDRQGLRKRRDEALTAAAVTGYQQAMRPGWIMGAALAGGIAAGLLSRKCDRETFLMVLDTCRMMRR